MLQWLGGDENGPLSPIGKRARQQCPNRTHGCSRLPAPPLSALLKIMAAMRTGIARMKVAQRCAAALCLQKKAPTVSVKMVAEQAGEERPQ